MNGVSVEEPAARSIDSTRASSQRSRISVVIRYVTFVGIFAHAGFIGLFAWLGVPLLACFNVGSVATWVVARAVNERGAVRLATALIWVEVVAHAAIAGYCLGWRSGFHFYVIPLIPFVIFNDQVRGRTAALVGFVTLAAYVVMRVLLPETVVLPIAPAWMRAIEAVNILVPFTALALVSVYFRVASLDVEQRMAELAMTDPLTALPNRRHMRDLLDRARAQVLRSGQRFGVIIGDIDGFKRINDTRGHDCGDQVLREVAATLRARLRAQDVAARWGGEEFLFLLPETDLAGAGMLAEKLRDAVASRAIDFGGERLQVTMTFGVSAFAGDRSVEDCVRLADAALYAGKGEGKNRVSLAPAAQA